MTTVIHKRYEPPKSWYFTFGGGSPFAFEYVRIEAETLLEARELMFELFGAKWSMCYDEAKFEGQAEEYGLHCLAFIRKNKFGNWRSREKGEVE